MVIYSVIMAGGGGTRFWPLSRQELPKQMHNITGNDIMINETIDRIKNIVPYENTYIVTADRQKELLKSVINPQISVQNILAEPMPRNTAPCILYAAMKIYKEHGDGIMFVLPADHYISNVPEFNRILRKAAGVAEVTDKLITIGIKPTFPSTGYGYIQYNMQNELVYRLETLPAGDEADGNTSTLHELSGVYEVEQFIEKPDRESAKSYIESGNFLWNSGMFIWKVSVIMDNFKRYLPRIYDEMESYLKAKDEKDEMEALEKAYSRIKGISIDYGILERSNDVYVIPGDFGWNDIGSWDALGAIFPPDENGNIIKADFIEIDTKNSIIYGQGKQLIATVGLKDMIVVNTDDALLICPKTRAQEVKDIVDKLKKNGRNDLL
ncbi:mannose-1-phosphate guanylyltransferase [Thermoclostridium caenicola]|uniref:mannose-1-phosphate guanylyltransferase n=1 Tax=Thermoclostridium caenicola TaxID=659425 RepID=A0A1M6IYK3_9FIRM|nr:mannose-1-phosphate guanylyltransferase [Thermoclostridium caenicola]SHJ39447.1 mannose-1-phosphate guanylyltransferase [Thermoclostridium caenicola]